MSERTINVEAETLGEAKSKVCEDKLIVLDECILCHGKVETIEAVADTVEEAFIRAQSRMPAGAKTEAQKVKVAPKRVTLQVQGDNEESAGKGRAEVIASLSLLKKGRKGIWGFGKTPNVYEVVISQQAVVELRFREQVKLRVRVRGYLAEDLFQVIQEIRRGNAWTEILQLLNPKNDPDIQKWLTKLQELSPLSVLDILEQTIEDICRKNEKANWRKVIKDAHAQAISARAAELKERDERLRKLDHQLAEELMIYVEIYWTTDYSELKGIPRFNYTGPYRPPDPKEKQDIPRYSSDAEAFRKLLNQVESLLGLYSQVLKDGVLSEATASLEQKCLALLEAQRRRRKK